MDEKKQGEPDYAVEIEKFKDDREQISFVTEELDTSQCKYLYVAETIILKIEICQHSAQNK